MYFNYFLKWNLLKSINKYNYFVYRKIGKFLNIVLRKEKCCVNVCNLWKLYFVIWLIISVN